MATAKLTKRTVTALPVPRNGESWLWDSELKGFGLKALPTGRKVYAVKYRVPGDRRTKKVILGPHGPLTPEAARTLAMRRLGEVASGLDPAQQFASLKGSPTIAGLWPAYLDTIKAKRKASTARGYVRLAQRHILPELGGELVRDLTRAQVSSMHLRLRRTPYVANRVLALLSTFVTWAIRQGYRPDDVNPCRYVERFPESGRERFLTAEEMGRLGATLLAAEQEGLPLSGTALDNATRYGLPETSPPNPFAVAAIRLLALTGFRLNEALRLRWEEIDEAHGVIRLADSKSGRSVRPLTTDAIELLGTIPREQGSPFVFPGQSAERPLATVKRTWERVRDSAGLSGVRLHDLRHTFASVAVSRGESLELIGKLLGHTQPRTTQRYSHLSPGSQHEAASRTSSEIAANLRGQTTPVTPLPVRHRQPARAPIR
jgi:integrase